MELGRSAIEREVDRGIDRIFKTKPDIASMLKNHPRKQVFAERLLGQLQTADGRNVIKSGVEHLAETIFLMTKTFVKAALEFEEQKLLSHAEISKRKAEASKIQDAEAIVRDAMPNLNTDDFSLREI